MRKYREESLQIQNFKISMILAFIGHLLIPFPRFLLQLIFATFDREEEFYILLPERRGHKRFTLAITTLCGR